MINVTFFLNMLHHLKQATSIIIPKQGTSATNKMQNYLSPKIMKQITRLTKRLLRMFGLILINTGLESIILLKEIHGCNSYRNHIKKYWDFDSNIFSDMIVITQVYFGKIGVQKDQRMTMVHSLIIIKMVNNLVLPCIDAMEIAIIMRMISLIIIHGMILNVLKKWK